MAAGDLGPVAVVGGAEDGGRSYPACATRGKHSWQSVMFNDSGLGHTAELWLTPDWVGHMDIYESTGVSQEDWIGGFG